MWSTKLKIAVVHKDVDTISKLLDDIPQLEDPQEIEEVLHLLKEATNIIQNLKNDTAESMKQMQNNIKFLKATAIQKKGKLDLKF